jgi:hypothetical protein
VSIAIARQLSICGLCVVLAAGCTLTPPPATPTPTSAQKDSTSPANAAISWKPRLSAGSWRYELLSTATVTLTGDPTASALPIGRTTVYTVSIAPTREPVSSSVPFEVVGSVDSVAVTTPGRIPTPTAGSNVRPHFRAELGSDGRVVNLTSDATTACQAAVDPLSAAALTLFVTIPPTISVGASWKDTVSTITCRGRMAVITTAIRQYKVVTDTVIGSRPALLLRRTDSLNVRNRPDTTSGQMTAAGAGSAAFLLYVDPASGMLLNATGQSHTEILVIAGDSRYQFREDAKQTIALLD